MIGLVQPSIILSMIGRKVRLNRCFSVRSRIFYCILPKPGDVPWCNDSRPCYRCQD